MSFSTLTTILIAAYVAASILYVYRWRGYARYPSFSQYLRKSWPVFAPFNCLLYLATRAYARQPVLDAGYVDGMHLIRKQWAQIRDEALALHAAGELDATTRPDSAGYYDVGFRTFYKRGWKKFYLKWYGEPHRSARRLCPQTVRIIEQVPGVRAAMFSVLLPGSELRLHSDPMACSLRYHLGLDTPESDRCFIDVDGVELSWRNGKDFVFDETYPHYAVNATEQHRLILMCDVDRPMNIVGRAFNRMYSVIAKAMAVPNTQEDKRGLFSWIFSAIAPWRAIAAKVKQKHRAAYVGLKIAFNATLVVLVFAIVYVVLDSIERTGATAIQ